MNIFWKWQDHVSALIVACILVFCVIDVYKFAPFAFWYGLQLCALLDVTAWAVLSYVLWAIQSHWTDYRLPLLRRRWMFWTQLGVFCVLSPLVIFGKNIESMLLMCLNIGILYGFSLGPVLLLLWRRVRHLG